MSVESTAGGLPEWIEEILSGGWGPENPPFERCLSVFGEPKRGYAQFIASTTCVPITEGLSVMLKAGEILFVEFPSGDWSNMGKDEFMETFVLERDIPAAHLHKLDGMPSYEEFCAKCEQDKGQAG